MNSRLTSILLIVGSIVGATRGDAQICDTILGGTNCGAPASGASSLASERGRPVGGAGFSTQDLVLAPQMSSSEPAMFGALTFGGSGITCSGPFRVRRC